MNIQIYTMTHKKFQVPEDSLYQPLHVGRAGKEDLGYPGDDTGEHISEKNCYYSELTGLYWIWKNVSNLDFVGCCHYRRYLINEQEKILTKAEYEALLSSYDLITTKRVQLEHSYYSAFSANHNIEALDMTGEVIKELYPDYYPAFLSLVHGTETYFGNMLVTSKENFDAYADWLFSIFFEVEKRINLDTDEDAYHKRVFGFISEFLLLVYVRVQQWKVCECRVGMLGEKAETREMKEKLAEFFKAGDISGAKEYFLKRQKERPDVLMEASDVTGELRLSMQIISTAELEEKRTGHSILEQENRFPYLIRIFSSLNQTATRFHKNQATAQDLKFLKDYNISETALEIAIYLQENAFTKDRNSK